MAFNHKLTAQNISEVSEQLKTELQTLKLNSKEEMPLQRRVTSTPFSQHVVQFLVMLHC